MEACSRPSLVTATAPSIIAATMTGPRGFAGRRRAVYRLVFLEPMGTDVTARSGATILSSLSEAFRAGPIQQRSVRPGARR
jgi:hypothetical protein